jgi:hypothetical protein
MQDFASYYENRQSNASGNDRRGGRREGGTQTPPPSQPSAKPERGKRRKEPLLGEEPKIFHSSPTGA